jgi:hypothetical protein
MDRCRQHRLNAGGADYTARSAKPPAFKHSSLEGVFLPSLGDHNLGGHHPKNRQKAFDLLMFFDGGDHPSRGRLLYISLWLVGSHSTSIAREENNK